MADTKQTQAVVVAETQAVTAYAPDTLRPADIIRQVALIQEVMAAVMKDGEHYGKIPGCGDKPTLLKPGAEILNLTFRMAPRFKVDERELAGGHREFYIECGLYSINSGAFLGMGVGFATTMESKYRYRNIADYELTGEDIPKDSKERKKDYRKQGFGMKKVEGVWEWVKYTDAEKVENPDPADTYNTVLKMGKKRAMVDAVLTVTAASDMFTQDIEELPPTDMQPTESAPVINKATSGELAAIEALFSDLGWNAERIALKFKQAGVPSVDDLTSDTARKLIANLGEILKASKSADAPMSTEEVLREQYPEAEVGAQEPASSGPDLSGPDIEF